MIEARVEIENLSKNSEVGLSAAGYRLGYHPELDGLRGISILLVMVHHFYQSVLPGGFLGVDIFFVLSGFLITSLLLKEWNRDGTIRIRDFYIRRALRLMPALIATVLLLSLLAFFFLSGNNAFRTHQGVWLTLSYVSNFLYAFYYFSADNPLGVTWSLAIEEQFYLLWPVILWFVLKAGMSRRVLLGSLTLSILAIVLYRSLLVEYGTTIVRLYYSSDTRADGLLIGCLVAIVVAQNLFSRDNRFEFYAKVLAGIGFFYLVFMALNSTWIDLSLHQGLPFTLIPLSAGMILVVLVKWPPRTAIRALSFAPLVWIGQVSYGLYLWHWPVRWFVYGQQNLPTSTAQLLLVVFLTLGLTTLSYYLIEKPFLRLKNRFSEGAQLANKEVRHQASPIGGA
ncbi:MAG: acyltransferase [Pyrinomonadaceae bacterium]|nr:acyltransferase [Pyrinomonadaceae bacterium]